jgi:hypothetical protein
MNSWGSISVKKRIVSVFFAVLLVIMILPVTAQAAGSLSNFTKANTYNGQFSDVPSGQWYAPYVQAAYEYGLMTGTSATTFSPGKNLTIAEALKMAACLHSIYNKGAADFSAGTPWYQPYLDYALDNGIISAPYANYTADATRSDFAVIFANALPDEALAVMNSVDDDAIPDVKLSYSYGPAVYKLYRAGILTGSDSAGTFKPTSSIQRSEVAAIAARMASVSYRKSLTLGSGSISAADIAAKCTPAVFYIELYDSKNEKLGNASGFFIDSSGLAVTNLHVIELASSAKITTKDGKQYDVSGFLGYDEPADLAYIQIDGSGFPALTIGNSKAMATGSAVYAIGYPKGVDQTVSSGIITNAGHKINDVSNFLIDTPISPGSSGGALVDANGQVIGVTRASYINGQNMNLAAPIDLLGSITKGACQPLSVLNNPAVAKIEYYNDFTSAPSFTSVSKTNPSDSYFRRGDGYVSTSFYYKTSAMTMNTDDAISVYIALLRNQGFGYDSNDTVTDGIRVIKIRYYYSYASKTYVGVGTDRYDGEDYVLVYVEKSTK